MRYGLPDVKSGSRPAGGGLRPHPAGAIVSAIRRADLGHRLRSGIRALMDMRWQPTIRVSPPYHDDPAYIAALADSIRNHIATLDFERRR